MVLSCPSSCPFLFKTINDPQATPAPNRIIQEFDISRLAVLLAFCIHNRARQAFPFYSSYMPTIYQDADKLLVIEFCKRHIEHNGYCGLFYAAKAAVPDKEFKNDDHKRAFIKSVSSLIVKDKKYRIKHELPDGNYDIEKDPGYYEKRYFERHPTQEKIFIAVLSAALTFCVNLYLSLQQKQSQIKIDSRQDKQIQALRDSTGAR